MRTKLASGALLLTAGLALMPSLAHAQTPSNVLLFPAVVNGDRNDSTKLVEDDVTEALRNQLTKLGIAAVVYNKRIPSVQRAINESDKIISDKDADSGPGDDNRKAKRFAEVVGASEYLTVFVDDYSFDAASRTAKFNLSMTRYNTESGQALGTFAKMQQGIAPADVAKGRQQASALARAAVTGGQQAASSLYPQAAVIASNVKNNTKSKGKTRSGDKNVVTIFGALLGVLYFSTR
ncbi:hypothetical protein [Armatimonas sp.]|uniref:hypothetical protein n=1 Tax=Armatimonas sp. TaxID=1872638 RepID=UPI00286C65BF|nr:hypothetical protein [Armatimonas sp.]